MKPFLTCARRHAELARVAEPALRRLMDEVESAAQLVADAPVVTGRVKGVLSTWIKARLKRCEIHEIDDLLGLRVVVTDEHECYLVLEALASRWTLQGEVDDYIKAPKSSGYRSLHAVLADGSSLRFEVQIRTRDMHEASERGRGAHWPYKQHQMARAAEPARRRGDSPRPPRWLGGTASNHASDQQRQRADRVAVTLMSSPVMSRRFDAKAVLTMVWSVVLVGVIGAIDTVSGFALDFSVLYLVPVSIATWRVSGVAGLLIAVVSTGAWWCADRLTAPSLVHPAIVIWNAAMHLGVFVLVSRTLNSLRHTLRHQQELLLTDQLTGVLSARGFFEVTSMHMEQARQLGQPLTLAFIDLDDFKLVNDRYGHRAADDLLRAWAQSVRRSLRDSDCVARLGGDEFGILLPDTAAERARLVLARLHEMLSAQANGLAIPLTFSMGAVTFTSVPSDLDGMLQEADTLMYEAKAHGKNSWQHEERP